MRRWLLRQGGNLREEHGAVCPPLLRFSCNMRNILFSFSAWWVLLMIFGLFLAENVARLCACSTPPHSRPPLEISSGCGFVCFGTLFCFFSYCTSLPPCLSLFFCPKQNHAYPTVLKEVHGKVDPGCHRRPIGHARPALAAHGRRRWRQFWCGVIGRTSGGSGSRNDFAVDLAPKVISLFCCELR